MSALPNSTYRVQLTRDFGFDAAAAIVPYLRDLGISHLYASPFLKARTGSTHGYDIVDHNVINPEFGGEEGFDRLSAALKEAGLGLILDFVPNHMGVHHADNRWWLDVLEWGKASPYARFFDISWDLLPYRRDGVMLPILGRPYGEALEAGEIELKFDADTGTFSAWYFEHRCPIHPARYGEILRVVAGSSDKPEAGRIRSLLSEQTGPLTYQSATAFKESVAALGAGDFIAAGLSAYDGRDPASAPLLHRLLERQTYRLAHWRIAVSGINYRRFFDINDLAGIRVEDMRVFRAIHEKVARLVAEGRLQGLRLDHIDGLRDPAQYLQRLQRFVSRAAPDGCHVTVEKILGEEEDMPAWPGVAGTTGYEWLNVLSRVLLNPAGMDTLDRTWRSISGETQSFEVIHASAKAQIMDTVLASEFSVLAQSLARIAAGHYSTRDFTPDRLREALAAYVIHFPVYRTYATAGGLGERDRALVEETIRKARARWTGSDPEVFDFLQSVVTLDLVKDPRPFSAPRIRDFALRLQQFTSPMMAKSLEDTAFYRYHRLIALNEVGGHPTAPALSADDFHAAAQRRAAVPGGLTATATHDTKRGEDARMRILALSDRADAWAECVTAWERIGQPHLVQYNGGEAPSAAHRLMLYQAMLGAWPGLTRLDDGWRDRVQAYALKAMREGKAETSWTNPDAVYERATHDWIAAMLSDQEFRTSFDAFAKPAAWLGALNSLSQTVLKLTMPGVPDIYQGCELWDLSFVDPDNRRPVAFDRRAAMLSQAPDWNALLQTWQSGAIKLAITHRLLRLRRERPALFSTGAYEPVTVEGADRDHVIAFRRSFGAESVVVAVARHFGACAEDQLAFRELDAQIAADDALVPVLDPSARGDAPFAVLPVAVWRSA